MQQLKYSVLKNPRIIEAFEKIDRADFVLPEFHQEAHEDYPLPIGGGGTISQPYTVAFMLELLQPEPGDKILDIGSGSGWSTALLAQIVGEQGKVVGLEIVPELVEFGQKNLAKYNFPNAEIRQATPGVVGLPNESPFDRILVSAAASKIPEELIGQLKSPGRLVIPVQNSIWLVKKNSAGQISKTEYPGFVFVPLK